MFDARWVPLLSLTFCFSCASSQDALVKRRDAIRAQRAQLDAPPPASYRSEAEVAGLRWGMTLDEVIAARGQPAFQGEGTAGYLDAQGPFTLFFFDGHLAQLKRYPPQPLPEVERGLTAAWGAPASVVDQSSELDAARGRDSALTATGLTLSILSGSPTSILWFLPGEERRLAQAQRTRGDRPARLVTWASKETSVYMAAWPGSVPEVTLISAQLGPAFVHQREAAR